MDNATTAEKHLQEITDLLDRLDVDFVQYTRHLSPVERIKQLINARAALGTHEVGELVESALHGISDARDELDKLEVPDGDDCDGVSTMRVENELYDAEHYLDRLHGLCVSREL